MSIANTTTNTTLKNVRLKLNEVIGVVNTLGTGNVSNTYLQSTFATKAYAASNVAIRILIDDRLQVANANAKFATKAYAASNTAVRLLINDRLQVANAAAKYATKSYAASNAYVNMLLANTNAYIADVAASSGGGGGGYSSEAFDYGLITSSIDVELNRDYGTL
jgi:hypothetical protein